ncbi:MAG: hypothetical protein M2R45_04811 [Verrucomicrobia subdivision 3 bacterium]|nr:hypothetical protein [Limisphaerales bacterium]MCS1417300.1 hypothetical protein [Limisphaerales bacterium]
MNYLTQDLHYACRELAKSPGFTAVALPDLGLGNRREHRNRKSSDASARDGPSPMPISAGAVKNQNGNWY